ncbi:transcription factor, Myb superfamily, partial [Delitschia confertaspora ATCC 74209]
MAPRTPKKWTAGEDDILRKEVAAQCKIDANFIFLSLASEGEVRDWCQIAGKLPGRTNKDCRKRWHNTMAGEFRKGQWTKTEDEQLLNAVGKHGQRWTVVATAVSTRSAEQCAKRWQQSLNPDLDRSEWTGDEDQKLMQAVGVIGRQWTQIQRMHFPERSKNAIKNR